MGFGNGGRARRSGVAVAALFVCLYFAGAAVPVTDTENPLSRRKDAHVQKNNAAAATMMMMTPGRRRLQGWPGSYPPYCASKCGQCTPCKPVHIPVPPGTPAIMEYYPEAWRCKCGNALYMP